MISEVSGFIISPDRPIYLSEARIEEPLLPDPEAVLATAALPLGLSIQIRRRGWVEFDFSGWARTKSVPYENDGQLIDFEQEWKVTKLRLLIMNCFMSVFYTKLERIHRINLPKFVVTANDQITRRSLDCPNHGGPKSLLVLNRSIWTGEWVSLKVFSEAVEDFKLLLNEDEKIWWVVENTAVAHLNHQNNHYSASAGVSWIVLERIMSIIWSEKIEKNECLRDVIKDIIKTEQAKGNRPPKFRGLNASEYNSWMMIEVLSRYAFFDEKVRQGLHILRLARNEWVHSMEEMSDLESTRLLDMTIMLLNILLPIELTWSSNTSYYSG